MKKRHARIVSLLVVAAVIFGPGAYQVVRLSWKARVLERRQRELEVARQRLNTEQQRLASDPVYVEGLIRSTFKVAKPGELVVPLGSLSSNTRRPVTRDQ